MNLFTLPPDAPFLDTLARAWLDRAGTAEPLAAASGMILLPTRRAARAMAEAFLRVTDGAALVLPRITALGALDEAPLVLTGALDLPPAIEPSYRLALLARLILAMGGAYGAPRSADRAWALAAELAALMDDAERAGIDLAARLPEAADPAFAAHWAQTVSFLRIVTASWPALLAELGLANPAARSAALLAAQAEAWERDPPTEPVWLAGTTAAIPAVARLAGVLARAKLGAVVLPGLDTDLPEAAWEALGPEHPQAGLRALLGRLGATRADVRPWPDIHGRRPGRVALLRTALLPGAALETWRDPGGPVADPSLCRLEAADTQAEALAIALILRDALERPGATAALVTPDRSLAGRVAAELLRFGVVADDSAGERLSDTPPASFLRLLARAVASGLAPVPLLALLKHPFAAAG
ncbi:MAG: double-strand break repair protein AddB, partial [Acetobacteraceae bacterium]